MEGFSCDLELGLRLGVSHVGAEETRRAATNEAATGSGGQLTILYKGDVCVCDNVSEAKAKAIMLLAGSGGRQQGSGATMEISCGDTADSALMMKRSLQRFLEKRKTRMQRSSGCPN
ncbi:hypothetical protein MLD38_010340 [Melastoma candidum]|uniref:Uncharacterized protein n=1 Tax=Melastoma candidum TaxID=119954 RepID=A0ACB9R1C0_9MYRT|nr:hypothetical protein MLD38_010340 [Melastoma candidum]